MRRRQFLTRSAGAMGTVGIGSLAGCMGIFETRRAGEPPVVEDRPNAVYYPTHHEGMVMAGVKTQGGYTCALTYSLPHRFWLVTGQRREKVEIASQDSLHLMPVVWDEATKTVIPDANPQITITQNGESVVPSVSPWPMLSQPMGFHFGDNVQLPGDGTYRAEIRVGGFSARRTGELADGNSESTTFEFEFEFSRAKLDQVEVVDIPEDKQGLKGAVPPRNMEMIPSTQVPKPEELPGSVRGSEKSGDAEFVITVVEDGSRFGGSVDQTYLAVSPRTPHNRYMLPMMSLSGTVLRGSETVFDGFLQSTLDSEVGYHYGAFVSDVQSGDELLITVDAPPQTARHEGYETAFVEMPEMTITL